MTENSVSGALIGIPRGDQPTVIALDQVETAGRDRSQLWNGRTDQVEALTSEDTESRLYLRGATIDREDLLNRNRSLADIFGPQDTDPEQIKDAKRQQMGSLAELLGPNAGFLEMPLVQVEGMLPPIPGPLDNSLVKTPYTYHLRLGTGIPGVYYHFIGSPQHPHDESTFATSQRVLLTQHISNRKTV